MTRWIWAVALAPAAGDLAAQPYVGSELGLALTPALRLVGTDNDWGTRCDSAHQPGRIGDRCGMRYPAPGPRSGPTNPVARPGFAAGLCSRLPVRSVSR